MPRYSVTITRTLFLSATVSVPAMDKDEASNKVSDMITGGEFGSLEWQVTSDKAEWEEDSDEIDIVSVEKD